MMVMMVMMVMIMTCYLLWPMLEATSKLATVIII